MSFKKIIVALLALVMVLGVFAACGKTEENKTPDPTQNQTATQAKSSETPGETTAAPTTAAPTEEPTTAAPTTEEPTTVETTTPGVPEFTFDDVPRPAAPAIPAIANPNSKNETRSFIVQESTFDNVFNPFFSSTAYDNDVIAMVNVGLLTLDPQGAVVCGPQYDTFGQSYEIFYTDNLETLAKKDTYEEGDYVVYEVVLKNGAFFSDGTLITADDVLFNYYVLLDPKYDGNSTMASTLPIVGLEQYRNQAKNEDTAKAEELAEKVLAIGPEYKETEGVTKEQYDFYWGKLDEQIVKFAQSIVDYVNGNYRGYAPDYFGMPYDDIAGSENRKIAYGMVMWGFGEFKDDGKFYGAATGKELNIDTVTINDYVTELLAAYIAGEDYAAEYHKLDDTEAANVSLIAPVAFEFVDKYVVKTPTDSITGLRKGVKAVKEGDEWVAHETFTMILSEQNPKAILDLSVTVTPKAYYTAGYEYKDGVVTYGVELNSAEFMKHLKTLNTAPVGAGVYKFVKYDGDGVTFVRNDYHFTLGDDNVYNAKIKNLYMKVVTSGKEFEALTANDVDYANPAANGKVMEDLAKPEYASYTPILVDNLGYGYICINPQADNLANLHTRIALTTVFDLSRINMYYPSGLAEVIYRSMSQVSWAYPENAQAIYPFDETLASAIAEFKLAGYTYDEATKKFTDVPTFKFYLPSAADDHPAGEVYLRAQDLLATIGVQSEIVVDDQLLSNIKTAAIPTYAIAWGSTPDPDLTQVYHWNSGTQSVKSNGIEWLHENGKDAALGTIDVVKLDGSTVTMTQSEALDYLASLIEEGLKYMTADERSPIYQKALEVLAQLNIEIPTYQRKNMFAYNNAVIDGTTLSSVVTPYWGPIAEIWKVSFVDGDANA